LRWMERQKKRKEDRRLVDMPRLDGNSTPSRGLNPGECMSTAHRSETKCTDVNVNTRILLESISTYS